MQPLYSALLILFAPALSFIISLLGVFDLKMKDTDDFFEKVHKLIRSRKIEDLKKIISINVSKFGGDDLDKYLSEICESTDNNNVFEKHLLRCRFIYRFYFGLNLIFFLLGVVLVVANLTDKAKDFLNNHSYFLVVLFFIVLIYNIFGTAIIYFLKSSLKNKYENKY